MRKYEPLWVKLKNSKDHKCIVEVHRLITSRVIKAVIKEKDQDLAFKMANEKNPVRLVKKVIPLADGKHVRIEFTLKATYGLDVIRKPEEIEL